MDKNLSFFLSLSILLPLIAALIRYRNVSVSYFPLIMVMAVGLVAEILNFIYNSSIISVVIFNIYSLIEFYLLLNLFHNWKDVIQNKVLYYGTYILLTLVWSLDNLVFHQLITYQVVYQVMYSGILVLLAVNQSNYLVVNYQESIIKNPKFIISISFIIFYSYKILVEIFYHFALSGSLKSSIFTIQSFVNVGLNILLFLAILCIPRKSNYIQL